MVLLRENEVLYEGMEYLPKNYNFELHKTIKLIRRNKYKKIGLQMPDGLLKYAFVLIDILKHVTKVEAILLGDVVYGACCIDDLAASKLGCDLLLHYGHSCIIPISQMRIKILYIFVNIQFDISHCVEIIKNKIINKKIKQLESKETKKSDEQQLKIWLVGTIQFNNAINQIANQLNLCLAQIKPLSKGEVLGCTSPKINDEGIVVCISDGRFHLESLMIRNPHLKYYKYCPYNKVMTKETFDLPYFLESRKKQIEKFKNCKKIGVIFGILGRQGNLKIFNNVVNKLRNRKVFFIKEREINIDTLDKYSFCDGFVQISCPRLSSDWTGQLKKPCLNAFELFYSGGEYVLDYYSREEDNKWNNA